jgi:cellulose synthase/poly-beta-1,6-N-acetylglucosamine synthase-like glycosyltransferase
MGRVCFFPGFHPRGALKDGIILLIFTHLAFSFPPTACIIYSKQTARFANIFRTVISTNFFTKKRYIPGTIPPGHEPLVTLQICSYNEGRVIEKTIEAACSLDWPRDKLCIQLLDDSTDQKSIDIAQEVCNYWQRNGFNCEYATRPDRVGYKAGNLGYHIRNVRGDFIAIMDSDHCCEPDYLRRAVPHFYHGSGQPNYEVGLVQTPW